MQDLKKEELMKEVQQDIVVQSYAKKTVIDGVKVMDIRHMVAEDGTFEELMRLNSNGGLEIMPEFILRQINRSKLLPGAIKAWHLHYKQDEFWYIRPEDHMMLGLWDLRENSPTKDIKMRILMGAGHTRLVYVPRGVAHGVANFSTKEGDIIYFVNNQFDINDPDENRLAWDRATAEFWYPEKG